MDFDPFAHVLAYGDPNRLGLLMSSKPSPLVLSAHLEHLGLRPADAAYIGDTPGDIQMARGAGVAAWGVGWSASGKTTLLHAGAERILDRMSDLQDLV